MSQVLELSTTTFYPTNPLSGTNLASVETPGYYPVIMVSSHPLFLVGLRGELNRRSEFEIVGEARQATPVLELVANQPVSLIIIDQARPGEAHLLVRSLHQKLQGRVPLVVLGSCETPAQIEELHRLGASAFASKELDSGELCRVLRQAAQARRPRPGIRAFGQAALEWPAPSSLRSVGPTGLRKAETGRVKPPLSPREIQILEVIAEGRSNKEVAQVLCISAHTLKNHLNNIFKKLDVEDRTQALMLGVRNGWVKL